MATSFLNWFYVGSSPTGDTMQDLSYEGDENLDRLVKLLQARLSSAGKTQSVDENGNTVYIDCDIFTTDLLKQFLQLSLSEFNQTPHFTNYSFDDTAVVDTMTDLLVEGAVLSALSSRALLERGREFTLTDVGVSFNPPNVSEMLHTQWATLLEYHFKKLKYVKEHIQAFPKS